MLPVVAFSVDHLRSPFVNQINFFYNNPTKCMRVPKSEKFNSKLLYTASDSFSLEIYKFNILTVQHKYRLISTMRLRYMKNPKKSHS